MITIALVSMLVTEKYHSRYYDIQPRPYNISCKKKKKRKNRRKKKENQDTSGRGNHLINCHSECNIEAKDNKEFQPDGFGVADTEASVVAAGRLTRDACCCWSGCDCSIMCGRHLTRILPADGRDSSSFNLLAW